MTLWDPTKIWLSSFSAIHLVLACSLPLIVVCFASETPTEETKFQFASGCQVGESFRVRDDGVRPRHLSADCAGALRAACCFSFWVPLCFNHVNSFRGLCFLGVIQPFQLFYFFVLVFCGFLWTLREGIWLTHSIYVLMFQWRSFTLLLMSGCVSLYLFPSAAGGSSSDNTWASHWYMSIVERLLNFYLIFFIFIFILFLTL